MSSVTVTAVGDVFLGGLLSQDIEKYQNIFLSNDIFKIFNSSDIRFCNLESPLCKLEDPPEPDKTILYAKPHSIDLLKMSQINIVSLANNHIMDFGWASLDETMRLLNNNGISCVGAGADLGEARVPSVIDVDKKKIAFLAYTWTPPQFKEGSIAATSNSPGVAPYNLKLIRNDVENIKDDVDFLIVSLHWGEEYTRYPLPRIISDAHGIIDSGVDVILGSHPHVLQGYEKYHNGLIFYSLSNFLFSPWHYTHEGRWIDYEGFGRIRRWYRKSREGIILNLIMDTGISYEIIPTLQRRDEPIVELADTLVKNNILGKLSNWSSLYIDPSYGDVYPALIEQERRFHMLKYLLNETETYGCGDMVSRITKKLLKVKK